MIKEKKTITQSIRRMHQYGRAFFEKYQLLIFSNRFITQLSLLKNKHYAKVVK